MPKDTVTAEQLGKMFPLEVKFTAKGVRREGEAAKVERARRQATQEK